jgi:hypothetical protein
MIIRIDYAPESEEKFKFDIFFLRPFIHVLDC